MEGRFRQGNPEREGAARDVLAIGAVARVDEARLLDDRVTDLPNIIHANAAREAVQLERMTRSSVGRMMLTIDMGASSAAVQNMQDHKLLWVVIFVAGLFIALLLLGPHLWHRWISELT